MGFVIKRIYEPAEPDDGVRILVDRLWPRGVSKEKAHLDGWFKDVTPSSELRKQFDHKPERFEKFAQSYWHELETEPEKQTQIKELREMSKKGKVSLLYAAKSPVVNHARVLQAYLEQNADIDWSL